MKVIDAMFEHRVKAGDTVIKQVGTAGTAGLQDCRQTLRLQSILETRNWSLFRD